MLKKARLFLIIGIFIIIILSGFLTYYFINKKNSEINVSLNTFDKLDTLTFDSTYVSSVKDEYEMCYKYLRITPKSKSDFINFELLKNEYYVKTIENKRLGTCYLFRKNGYNFTAIDKGTFIDLYNPCINVSSYDIAFPFYEMVNFKSYEWKDFYGILQELIDENYNCYEDYKDYYSEMNEYLVAFDDDSKTIKLRGYNKYYTHNEAQYINYSLDWYCQIKFEENGITIEEYNE